MPDNDTLDTPPASTSFEPAEPLKNAGVGFEPGDGQSGGKLDQAKQLLRDNTSKLTSQAGDKARAFSPGPRL